MTHEWHRLMRKLCADRGWKGAELLRRINADGKATIEKAAFSKYWQGRVKQPRGQILERIAEALELSPSELRYGVTKAGKTNAIPLLEANEVGTMAPLQNISDVWGGVRMTVVSADLAENTFSFVVSDDACAPKFEAGDIVICEEVSSATPGKFVVAKVNGVEQGILRKYRPRNAVDNSRFALVPTNEDFPTIEVNDDHPGFVVGQVIKVMKDV